MVIVPRFLTGSSVTSMMLESALLPNSRDSSSLIFLMLIDISPLPFVDVIYIIGELCSVNNYTPNRRRDKGVEVVYDNPCVVYFLGNKVPAGRRELRRNQKEIKLKKYTKGNIICSYMGISRDWNCS